MEVLLTAFKKQRLTISEPVKGHQSFALTSSTVYVAKTIDSS
jgi:hypothetical protein